MKSLEPVRLELGTVSSFGRLATGTSKSEAMSLQHQQRDWPQSKFRHFELWNVSGSIAVHGWRPKILGRVDFSNFFRPRLPRLVK